MWLKQLLVVYGTVSFNIRKHFFTHSSWDSDTIVKSQVSIFPSVESELVCFQQIISVHFFMFTKKFQAVLSHITVFIQGYFVPLYGILWNNAIW